MANLSPAQIVKELERKAGRLEGEAKGLREMADSLRETAAVTEPLLRAFEAAQAAQTAQAPAVPPKGGK